MDAEEVWNADDEDSGSEKTLDPFAESMSEAGGSAEEDRPVLHFRVRRENTALLGASGKSDGWINSSHFLWAMCAALADGDTDREWTVTFEKWRPQWNQIQTQVRSYGYTHFSSEFSPPPVDLASVRFLGSQCREFDIEQNPHDASDCQDIWTLWRYVIETPADEIRDIHVCLKNTARLVESQ
ncbi:hypothetical protein N7475_001038 [Penicillium sp. IBT 31633x]|nr:hypothetical protein N7475_001038 [Penicillium sp. IBT 31633x]